MDLPRHLRTGRLRQFPYLWPSGYARSGGGLLATFWRRSGCSASAFACDLLYLVGFVALTAALYVVLKPVSPGLAFLSAVWKLIYVAIWSTATINLFDALRLLQNAGSMGAFEAAQVQSLARFYLGGWFDRYYAALLFSALGSTVAGYVWFKSRYIPRVLAAAGVMAAAFCTLCTLAFIVFPHFDTIVSLSVFDLPMAIVDIVTSFWLIFKGLKLPAVIQGDSVAV